MFDRLTKEEEKNMKIVRFEKEDQISYGLLHENNEITKLEGTPFTTYSLTKETFKRESVKLLSPCVYTKALCIGLNYRDHAVEFGLPIPKTPMVFMKPPTASLNPQEEIVKPAMCQRLDYEGEMAIVIKKKAHHIKEEDVQDYILGYTCANDVTARDLQPHDGQWTVAKGFDTFCPFGPYISDEVDPNNLKISSILDGKVMQESNTSNLIFSPSFLVSYLSQVMTLNPGDIILTGTPSGISGMKKGATIEITIEGLGTLTNTIAR